MCDGERLFKDPVAEKQEKMRKRQEKKDAEKSALLKTHKKEKKEGMAFEKKVAKQWNQKFGNSKKKSVAKPRFEVSSEDHVSIGEIDASQVQAGPPKYQRDEAQRQFNSGAFWHSKGDIKLEHALMECKERGTVNSRGQKQITIPKEWIEKQEKEALQEQRPYWYIPFGYKNDDDVYLVKSYDHEIEMIYELRQARQRIEELEEELEKLRGRANEEGTS